MVTKPGPGKDDDSEDEKPEGEAAPPKKLTPWDKVMLMKLYAVTYLRAREFRLVPSLMSFIGVIILLGLGTWQVMRHNEKNILLTDIKTHLAEPAQDLRLTPPQKSSDWEKLNYRMVTIQGTWVDVHEFKMIPRTYEGTVGYHLLIPLRLRDGQIVIVNRGFIPNGQAVLPNTEEKVFAVQGVLRIPETRKAMGTPENEPTRGLWTWVDLAAMRHEIGVNSVAPVILYEAREAGKDAYPIGGVVPLPSHNRHKQYAFTWFALATALLGVYMISSGPKPEKIKPSDEQAAANDDEAMKDPVARRGMYPEATD